MDKVVQFGCRGAEGNSSNAQKNMILLLLEVSLKSEHPKWNLVVNDKGFQNALTKTTKTSFFRLF